jgi:hypothetical protein
MNLPSRVVDISVALDGETVPDSHLGRSKIEFDVTSNSEF